MPWSLLADGVVVLHAAFIVFAVLGAFLALRWKAVLFAHVPALAWAIWIAITGSICPLTPLENHLRALAGEAGYSAGFIEHYLLPLIYPVGLTPQIQWMLAAVLVIVNVVAYQLLIRRNKRAR